jgi:hypothetical protein
MKWAIITQRINSNGGLMAWSKRPSPSSPSSVAAYVAICCGRTTIRSSVRGSNSSHVSAS